MAKGNSPIKKLRDKEKARVLKLKCGNENSVMSYCMKNRSVTSRALDLEDIQDKPLPKKPPTIEELKSGARKLPDRADLPMVQGWRPTPYALQLNRSERRALLRG